MVIVQETNRYTINRQTRWMYQECWVRTDAGRVELWEIPLRPWTGR